MNHFVVIAKGISDNQDSRANFIMAGSGAGKSTALCHTAARFAVEGKSILYLTADMIKEAVAERISRITEAIGFGGDGIDVNIREVGIYCGTDRLVGIIEEAVANGHDVVCVDFLDLMIGEDDTKENMKQLLSGLSAKHGIRIVVGEQLPRDQTGTPLRVA